MRRIEVLTRRLKPFSFSYPSLSTGGQLRNPNIKETIITPKMIHLKQRLNSLKNPLTQAATTLSLKISRNALEIASRLWSSLIFAGKISLFAEASSLPDGRQVRDSLRYPLNQV